MKTTLIFASAFLFAAAVSAADIVPVKYRGIVMKDKIGTIVPNAKNGLLPHARADFPGKLKPGRYAFTLEYKTTGNPGGRFVTFVQGTSLQTPSWQNVGAAAQWTKLEIPFILQQEEAVNLTFSQNKDVTMGKFQKLEIRNLKLVPAPYTAGKNLFPDNGYFTGVEGCMPGMMAPYHKIESANSVLTGDFGYKDSDLVFRIDGSAKPASFVSRNIFFPYQKGYYNVTVYARAEKGTCKLKTYVLGNRYEWGTSKEITLTTAWKEIKLSSDFNRSKMKSQNMFLRFDVSKGSALIGKVDFVCFPVK